jgi:hypothetical protein
MVQAMQQHFELTSSHPVLPIFYPESGDSMIFLDKLVSFYQTILCHVPEQVSGSFAVFLNKPGNMESEIAVFLNY